MSTISLPLLSQVRIASPCALRWDEMVGTATTRTCVGCGHLVHNLSAMTAEQAERFLAQQLSPGVNPACVAFYRREDGTIRTEDCPVGLARWRRRAAGAAGRIAAAVLMIAVGGVFLSAKKRAEVQQRLRATQPFRAVCEWISPSPPAPAPVAPRSKYPILLGGIPLLGDLFRAKEREPLRADGTPYVLEQAETDDAMGPPAQEARP